MEEREALLNNQKQMKVDLDDIYEANKKSSNEFIKLKKAIEDAKKEIIFLHPSTNKIDMPSGRRDKDHRGLGFHGNTSASSSQTTTTFVCSTTQAHNVV